MRSRRVIKVIAIIVLILLILSLYGKKVIENGILKEERDYYKELMLNFCDLSQTEAQSIKLLHKAVISFTDEFDGNVSFTDEILKRNCEYFVISN